METLNSDGERKTILLVQDNPDHAELIIRALNFEHLAFDIHHAKDGEEALDYLYNRGAYADSAVYPTPQLILLDLHLPKIDGIDVLKEIKSNGNLIFIPVVILSASSALIEVSESYEHHANSYVELSADFSLFAQMMKDLVNYWFAWNTPRH
jgi:CheY-like chemotaxis protein